MTIILKLLISVLLCVGLLLSFRYRKTLLHYANLSPSLFLGISILCLRIIPFVLIYLVLGQDARSDVGMFYESATAAKQLLFVYRDFDTAYQPLFPYITALPLFVWDSPKAIVAEMILIEISILYLNTWLTRQEAENSLFKSLVYLWLPAPFVLSILGGQEDIWMWGFGAMAMLFSNGFANFQALNSDKNKSLALGIVFGMSLVVTKVVMVLLLPAIFLYLKERLRFVIGLLIVGIPTLGILYVNSDLAFLKIIEQANDPRTPNVWSILNPFLNVYQNIGVSTLNWLGLASILIYSIFLALKLRNNTSFGTFLPKLWVLTFCWFMLIQQSSLANYSYIFLMTMVFFLWNGQLDTSFKVLLLFNFCVVIQPALWWSMNMPIYTAADLSDSLNLIEYTFEVVIVACLIYFTTHYLKDKYPLQSNS